MSTEEAVAAADEVCASCGIAANDDVKLMKCACNLVKYCSVACQKNHRPQHKKMCKKRLAEIRDDDLFTQPEKSCFGDCPICCLPLSIDLRKCNLMSCCSKLICRGCTYANQVRENKAGLKRRCAFCREPLPKSMEEFDKYSMNRIKKNCPVALREEGKKCLREGDYQGALEYLTKAAELGDAEAHYEVSIMYRKGEGVDKDMKKFIHHSEQAAIGGHPTARHNLGCYDWENGSFERARKHFIIAANLGYHESLENIKDLYTYGHASKGDYANALRAYQSAVEATKSSDREEAEEAIKNGRGRIFIR
jgi:tetratricopeptide (TPR) repeat protein